MKKTEKSKGVITAVADGVCWLTGLADVMYGELVDFGNDLFGLALSLEEERVGVITFGEFDRLKQGDTAASTGKLMQINVSDEMVGRVVDPLGRPLDELPEFTKSTTMEIEKIAPGIIERKPVDTPLQT